MAKGFSLQETSNLSDEEKINYFRGLPGFGEIEDQIRARDWGVTRAEFEVTKEITEGRAQEREMKGIAQRGIGERKEVPLVYDAETREWIDAETARQRETERLHKSGESGEVLRDYWFSRGDYIPPSDKAPDDPRVPWERPPLDPIEVDLEERDPQLTPLPAWHHLITAQGETGPAVIKHHKYLSGNFVLDLLKLGQDLGNPLIPESSPEAMDIFYGDTKLPWEENITRLNEINQKRPFGEQLALAGIEPINLLGLVPLKTVQTVKVLKAADNINVFNQIINKIPMVLDGNKNITDNLKGMKEKLVNEVMNRPIHIEGVPDGSLYEIDLKLWLNMPAREVVDISPYVEEVISKAGTPGALHMAELDASLGRLVDLGLITKDGRKYTKRVLSGSPEAIAILENYGKVLGVSGGADGTEFVKPIRSFKSIIEEIVTAENPLVRGFLKEFGINPSVTATTDAEKAIIAYARQTSSINELVEVALQGGLDFRTTRATVFGKKIPGVSIGQMPVKIDKDGIVKGTGTHWLDVFSDPKAFISKIVDGEEIEILSKEALEYIKSYKQLVDEMELLRLDANLEALPKKLKDLLYIPRQSLGVDDIRFLRESNPHFERKFDTATEGRIVDEIIYEVDPRANLKAHLKAGHSEILDKQLNDFVAENVPSVTVSDIFKRSYPVAYETAERALKRVTSAEKEIRRLRGELRAVPTQTGGEFIELSASERLAFIKRTSAQRKEIEQSLKKVQTRLDKAKNELKNAKAQRSRRMEEIRQADTAPGSLWGDISKETIPVKAWNNRIYKIADYEALSAGIDNIAGGAGKWAKVGGRFIDTSRWLQANGDFGVQFIQGLVMLTKNPVKWSKSTLVALQAFADPAVQARFVNQNLATFQEMAQYGVPLGDVEFFAAMQKGRGLSPGALMDLLPHEEGALLFGKKGPEAGGMALSIGRGTQAVKRGGRIAQDQTFGRFQATYSMFLAMSRALLWKSMRESWVKPGREGNTLPELAAYIRNMTGALDSKALGISTRQREVEGAWMAFSPRLLRSTVALVYDAMAFVPAEMGKAVGGTGATARQAESARAISQFLTGVHGLYTAAAISSGIAKGHSQERIWNDVAEGLNPLNGSRYLSLDINGQNIGVGGQVRALFQFQVALVSSLAPGGKPIEDLLALNTRDNPYLQFLANRAALGPQAAGTLIEGITSWEALPFDKIDALPFENVDGPIDMFGQIFTDTLPFAIQGYLEGDTPLGIGLGMTGLRSTPESPTQEEKRLLKDGFYKMSAEELAEYDHINNVGWDWLKKVPGVPENRPDFPDNLRDLDRRLRDKLTEENPDIELARERNLERQEEQGGKFGEYRGERNDHVETRDNLIREHVRIYSSNTEEMRFAIARAYAEYGEDIGKLEAKYESLMDEFDEIEQSESPFNRAEDEYWKVMTSESPDRPSLVDPETLEYNYTEREARKEELRNDPDVAPFFEDIEERIRERAPDIVQELTKDRNFLKPYWTITEEIVADENFTEKYDYFKKQDGAIQSAMRKGEVVNRDWTTDDWGNLQIVIDRIQNKKDKLKETDPDSPKNAIYEALLYKWGYIDIPTNFEVILWVLDMGDEQGGAVIDRLQIESKIEAWAAEHGISLE